MEAIHLPPGELHSRLMLDSPMRDRMAAFTMQGEDLPQATNRVDLDPHVRDVWGLPAGRVDVHARTATRSRAREHWAPRLEAVMREAGADIGVLGDVAAAPRAHRRDARRRPDADLAPHHGDGADGRRPAHERLRPLAAAPRRRERARARTRRCSRPRPATARRSRSWPWRSAPAASSPGSNPSRRVVPPDETV